MKTQISNEVIQFNNSPKNTRKISKSKGYAFVSCPDFKHKNGKYEHVESFGSGLPLYMQLAGQELKILQKEKPVHVFLSDHELMYDNLLLTIGETREVAQLKIADSLQEVKKHFSDAALLSDSYDFEFTQSFKPLVPRDLNFENELKNWSHEGLSRETLEQRYINRFAQVKAFLTMCQSENLCAIFLYTIFTFKIVSIARKEMSVPIVFLDVHI